MHLESRVILLNKKPGSIPTIQDLRPIAIQNSIQKMTEISMVHYFKRLNDSNTSTKQFRFKSSCSTAHAVSKFYSYLMGINKTRGTSQPKGVVLIDFSKAYDRVDREKLYSVLEDMKIQEGPLKLLKAIHNNSRTLIGDIKVRLMNGLPQGSVLSPHLFNLFVDSLIRRMEQVNEHVWAFADDLAFGFITREEYFEKCRIIDE